MIRTQIQLTEEQAEGIKELAMRRGASMAEIIREAVDEILQTNNDSEKWERAKSVAGKYHSGLGDIAERHDDYLAEDFR